MIVDAVERELTARGLTKVAADRDLLIVYLAASGAQSTSRQCSVLPSRQSCLQRNGGGPLNGNVGCYDGHPRD